MSGVALAASQQGLLADTSPFCRFAEAGELEAFVKYLGAKLLLTPWVIGELEHRMRQPPHAALRVLYDRDPPWTPNEPVDLSQARLDQARRLAAGWTNAQEKLTGVVRDEDANLGEATVIVAALDGGQAILLDEGVPKKFAAKRGLTVITAADLVVEMCAAGTLKPRPAFLLYRRVYRGTQAQFDAALKEVTVALGV